MPPRPHVLFVCTANQCRSPLARAIAEARAGGLPVDFDSAGLLRGGAPVPPVGLQLAEELGLELSGHRSRQYDPEELVHSDLVLTMTREHARELLAEVPELWPRVFTVKQFARWARGRRLPRHVELGQWLATAADDRQRTEMLGADPDDDIADPVDQPIRVWRQLAVELGEQLDGLVAFLAGSRDGRRDAESVG